MIASSWMDPVLGVDMHWELVPVPPGAPVPMPFPHPYIGIVVDLGGLAGSMIMSAAMSAVFGAPFAGPVIHWFMPATNTGTESKHVPGHFIIPPGTFWAPVPRTPKPVVRPGETVVPAPPIKPENDAVCITGSLTVHVGGSNAVRLGDMLLSCSEPVRLPSSVVLAIPKGAPILVGGPPALDLMAAFLASLKTRFVSDSLHALVSRLAPGRFRNLLNRAVCFFTGHPVDVASGKVMTSSVEVELPGPLPLRIERVYSSAFGGRDGPLGHGWSLSLDQAIWTERGKVVLLAEDGRELEFDAFDLPEHRMRPGDRLWHPIDRLELECLEGGSWRVTGVDGRTREFGPVPGREDGRAMIQRIRSRCRNHEIAFEYDEAGRLEWVRDACGRLVWLERDVRGRIVKLKLPLPKGDGFYVHRTYAYDGRGDLARVTDALGHSWRFEYVTHLLVRETDRTDLSFHFEYDGLGQDAWCTRTWGDGGIYDHKLAYDKVKKVTFVTDSLGHTTQYHMNLAGLVVKVVDPLGGERKLEYDRRTLQKTAEIDPLGKARRWEYDAHGNCTLAEEPDGSKIVAAYDAEDRVRSAVDACGGEWGWEYVAGFGSAVRERNPLGREHEYHAESGLLRSAVDPLGARTDFEYDAQKNLTLVRNPDGAETRLWYDALGRSIRFRNALGAERRTRYDLEGRVVEVREADGNVRSLAYDAEGELVTYRDALREVKYGYAGFHRLAWQEEGGATRRHLHDTEGRLIAAVNEAGEEHRFVLDERGEVVAETRFDGATTRYERDAAGRLVGETRPSGASTKVAYDPLGRVVRASHSDGTVEEYGYRPDGQLAWAANQDGRVEFVRDALGRVVKEIQGDHFVESVYDACDRRETVQSSLAGGCSAIRTPSGEIARLVGQGWDVAFERDLEGSEVERRLPGEVVSRWRRDSFGRLDAREVRAGGALLQRQYEWGMDQRLLAIVDSTRGETRYRYDTRGRLSAAEQPSGLVAHRVADARGNLFRTPEMKDRDYGPGGEIDRAADTWYQHDRDGNLVEKRGPDGAWKYAWTGSGRLAEVTRPDGSQVSFAYDALGRRVLKRTAAGETRFVWDGDVPLHELSSTEGLSTWYFEPHTFAPVAKEQGGKRYFVVGDHLGTPTELFDEAGAIAWQMQLDLFGAGKPDVSTTACPWRWPGQYEDAETGLYYNRHRYYDPESGRYISRDPVGLAGGLHSYAYTENPVQLGDPLGLLEPGEIAGYGTKPHVGDGLEAHELLQHAFLKARGITNASNPAIALPPDLHALISRRQPKIDFLTETAAENIARNMRYADEALREALKNGMITPQQFANYRVAFDELNTQATEHAKKKGCY